MKKELLLLLLISLPMLAASGHMEGYVPAAANQAGAFSSQWTTDVWIYHQGASQVHLWFNPAGQDNTYNQSVVVNLDGPVTYIENIVETLFETDGFGSLHYLADGPVLITSRTWTSDPDGGSYGQTIQGMAWGEASFDGSGQAGTHRMMVNKRGDFRANLGLVNISPNPVIVQVEIFLSDGTAAPGDSAFTVDLPPFGMTQVDGLLSRVDGSELDGLIVRAGVSSGDGAVMAYISLVNNTTNDASYIEGFRFSN